MSTSATGIIGAAATTSGPTTTSTTSSTTNSADGSGILPATHLDKDKTNLLLLSTTTNQSQPMDLAPRGPSVVQLRPVRPIYSTLQSSNNAKQGGSNNSSVGVNNNGASPGIPTGGVVTPIISVNRSAPGGGANLTILPAKTTGPVGISLAQGNTQGIPTFQITRVGVGNTRPTGIGPGQQPITVTPLPTSNLSANIRLAGTTVNNGTWLQTSSVQGFAPIRAATITVGGRPVRPADGKMIHIPQQHVTQLQMVDSKGSILKPQLSTPIVNIRGTLPGGATSGSVTLPMPPFTIRTANITNISVQPRPPVSSSTIPNPVHKVITHGHNAPIQFVNANKNVIQAITPIPKLSTVCLTLSTNATLTPNNSSPIVAASSRQTGTTPSLIMTPSSIGMTTSNPTGNTPTTNLPITKVFPVGRDGSILENMNMFSSSGSTSAVSVSTVNLSTVAATANANASNPCVVVATSHPQHVLVHTTPTINVHAAHSGQNPSGLPPPNLAPGSIAPSYYVDKTFQMNIVPHSGTQVRPISLEKKIDPKSLPPGSMIIAASTTHPNTVTIPLGQHLNIAHLGQPPGNTHTVNPSSTTVMSTSATSSTPLNHHPHQQLLAQIPHSMMMTSSSGGGPIITVTPSSQNQQNTVIPTPSRVISQSIGVAATSAASVLTVTTTTISSSSTFAGSSSISSTTAPVTNSISSTNSTSTSTSSSITTTAPPAQSPNHNNPNSNTNTKATHSPRPSILRKRELGDHHHQSHSASRAQRNLSLQLNFSTSNSTNFTSSSNKENSLGLEKFQSGLSTITGSSGGSGGATTGVSILKKEFQPPTEESSWQSVSSNSSSGSSTISTTSETAELQLQQQQLSITGGVDLNLSTSLPLHSEVSGSAFVGLSSALSNSISGGKSSTIGGLTAGLSLSLNNNSNNSSSTTTITTSSSQNGVLRTTQPINRSRSSSTSKGANKDVERLKNKDKDLDGVSPRKKPRKQQLTSSDLLEAASPEIYYQGKGKRFRKGDLMDFTEGITEKEKVTVDPIPEEEPPPLRIVYYVKKPHMSLVKSNIFPPKPLATHFQRYCDVKAKDEKRPTISELANQKNVVQKVGGWRVKLMTNQMQELVDNETGVVDQCTTLLSRLETKVGPHCAERDLNIVMELLKGNIQRCKVIRDQMSDSKTQAIKILDHKATVTEVINKHSSKRPQNKKRIL